MSPDRTNWAAVAFGLSLAWFAAFQMFKLPPVLPLLLETYGYDLVLAGGFMSIYAAVGLLVSGVLGVGMSSKPEPEGREVATLRVLADHVAAALSKARIVKFAYQGLARPATTPVPPTMPGHHDGIVDRYVDLLLATARSKTWNLTEFLFERDIRRKRQIGSRSVRI